MVQNLCKHLEEEVKKRDYLIDHHVFLNFIILFFIVLIMITNSKWLWPGVVLFDSLAVIALSGDVEDVQKYYKIKVPTESQEKVQRREMFKLDFTVFVAVLTMVKSLNINWVKMFDLHNANWVIATEHWMQAIGAIMTTILLLCFLLELAIHTARLLWVHWPDEESTNSQ